MNFLIIGCGYVGRRAAESWLRWGHHVSALTRSAQNAAQLSEMGISPYVGDVLDPASLAALPAADVMLYAVGFDRTAGPTQRDIYVHGLDNVLNHAADRAERLIYLSSTSVYGQTDGTWVDESSPCRPARPNGQVCLEAETLLLQHEGAAARESRNILRLAGIYGPDRLLARVEALRSGEPLKGNPDAFLNLIYVDDIVRSIDACLERGGKDTLYLVCDDRPITRLEYYSELAKLSGAAAPRFVPGDTARHSLESLNKRCRNTRLRSELQVELAYPTITTGLPAALGLTSRDESP